MTQCRIIYGLPVLEQVYIMVGIEIKPLNSTPVK
jgi:hypothetical protein